MTNAVDTPGQRERAELATPKDHRSIFSPATAAERARNFEAYWEFSQDHSGELFEDDKDLSKKRERRTYFEENPVRSRLPLPDPEIFYRNYVHLSDDPAQIDRKTLLLMCVYKFARHEWVGISGAWDRVPSMAEARSVTDKISRYHLAEEFCHVRFFHEMFRVFHLDRVEWVPLGPVMQSVYKMFPYVPGVIMNPPAFVTELMGITFYLHLDALFDEVFADEPEARDRLRELLTEIVVDEVAHAGQRRNFIGALGMKASYKMVAPLYRTLFKDIPEAKYLFDVDRMIADGQAFDYSTVSEDLLARSWIPTYCQ